MGVTPARAVEAPPPSCRNISAQVVGKQLGALPHPPPCPTQTVSWGAGCQGTAYASASGSSENVTASYGTGSATYVCSSGNWALQSVNSCTLPPKPCSGTYSWGGGQCSASYRLGSGQTQALNAYSSGPSQAGGTYTGSAQVTCNDGSVSPIGTPVCTYDVYNPEVINVSVASQQSQPTGVHLSAGVGASWCNAVLPGSSVTVSTPKDIGPSGEWTCWNPSGYTCAIPWDGSAGGGNGQSCWWYAQSHNGYCYVTDHLQCQRTGP